MKVQLRRRARPAARRRPVRVDAGGRRLRKATMQTCNKDDRTAAARVERKGLLGRKGDAPVTSQRAGNSKEKERKKRG
jgi:hypothetical protein